MDTVMLSLVKWFIERQLIKFGESIDWVKVKADCQARILQLLPNSAFDAAASYIVGVFIDIIDAYFVQNAGTKPSLTTAVAAVNYAQSNIARELATRAMKTA